MVHASGTVGCMLAGVFKLRAGEWVDVVNGCSVNVSGISAKIVKNELVVVVYVALVHVGPNFVYGIVEFVGIAGVGVCGLSKRPGLVAFECGNWFRPVLLKRSSYGSGPGA